MIYEHIEGFVETLLEQTKNKKIEWKSINSSAEILRIIPEIELVCNIDFGVNTIATWKSFYTKKNEGYVFLVYILHGDYSVTSPEMDTIRLLTKINNNMEIIDLSSYIDGDEHQQRLNTLKMIIDSFFEEKNCMPDVLYNFMDSFCE